MQYDDTIDCPSPYKDEDKQIQRLKSYYLQSVPADKIPFDILIPPQVSWPFQVKLYNAILSKSATPYPPAPSYTRRFLKFLINKLQDNLAEDGVCNVSFPQVLCYINNLNM